MAVSHKFFPTDRASTVMGAAATAYVNSNNIGLPVGMYVLGNAGYVAPLLVVQMTIFTPLVLALISDNNTTGSRARKVGGAIASSLLSPIVVAAFLGLIIGVTGITIPKGIVEPIRILGGASIPMILMSFGASLTQRPAVGGSHPAAGSNHRHGAQGGGHAHYRGRVGVCVRVARGRALCGGDFVVAPHRPKRVQLCGHLPTGHGGHPGHGAAVNVLSVTIDAHGGGSFRPITSCDTWGRR